MTIYTMDTEADGLLDTATHFHCLVFKALNKDKNLVFCDYKSLDQEYIDWFKNDFNAQFFDLNDYHKLIDSSKTTGLICHNIFGYDLRAMKQFDGLTYDGKTINDRNLFLCDTLVMSRNLNPERRMPKGCPGSVKNTETGKMDKIGPHGLESWGYRVGVSKPTVHDWTTQPLEVYIHRCIEDVKINELTYFHLLKDMEKVAIPNGNRHGDWGLPMRMSTECYRLMIAQEETGVCFDIKAAEKLVVRVDKEMGDIESEIEPALGKRKLPANQQPTLPKVCWKKAFDYSAPWTARGKLKKGVTEYLKLLGYSDEAAREKYITGIGVGIDIEEMLPKHPSSLSASAIRFCEKFNITDPEEQALEIKRLSEKGEKPKVLVEKLRLKHKKDVKEFLMKQGWKPTIWKSRNIMVNPKTKGKLSKEETEVKLEKYLKEFIGSIYWPYILKDLGYKTDNVDTNSKSFRAKCFKQGRGLMSAPQYKDQRGVRCLNLKKLTGDTSKLIIRWLSLQNRRNTIQSTAKETGWLHHPRLKIDGRLPARSSGITPTYRQKHSVVVNVPKPKDHVVLGKEMRALFYAPPGWWNIGCDASGIEQRVAGHFAFTFDNGVYAAELLEGDAHSKNAEAYSVVAGREINRDDGKNLTYAIMYGAQAKKIANMASVDEVLGQFLIDAFWDNNPGLKAAKEALIAYWEAANKQYVMGIDGRKIITRSKHSIMNALFQSTGALIMDYAGCWAAAKIEREGLNAERWGYIHDEYQYYQLKQEVVEERFPENEKPEQHRGERQWSDPRLIDGEWVQHYSRVGEIIALGMEAAGRYFNMNLPFPGEYKVGANWSECH